MKKRLASALVTVVSAVVSVHLGFRLASYEVPWSLTLAAGGALFVVIAQTLGQLVAAMATTTHRCTKAGCDFRVQLTSSTAADNRRWQEAAANHPNHV